MVQWCKEIKELLSIIDGLGESGGSGWIYTAGKRNGFMNFYLNHLICL